MRAGPYTRLALVIAGILFAARVDAVVFGLEKVLRPADEAALELTVKSEIRMRINDRDITARLYRTGSAPEEICNYYRDQAKKAGRMIVDLPLVDSLALFLLKEGAGNNELTGYKRIYFADIKKGSTLAAAAYSGGSTLAVKLVIRGGLDLENFRGYDDGLEKMPGLKKVMSMEFLRGGRTVNFCNFYKTGSAGAAEIKNYYTDSLKKGGWQVLFTKKDGGVIYIKKGKKEYLINIVEENGERWIYIIG